MQVNSPFLRVTIRLSRRTGYTEISKKETLKLRRIAKSEKIGKYVTDINTSSLTMKSY